MGVARGRARDGAAVVGRFGVGGPAAKADPTAPVEHSVQYVVVAGDCLWNIAARVIGPGASNAAIDRGWRAIYVANRSAIGGDPGLIHPGLVLTIPAFDPTP